MELALDDSALDDSALVVGEALVDVVRRSDGTQIRYPGGSPANVAVALARLDRPTRLATCFADDELGRLLAEHLERNGVRLAGDPGASNHTSSAVARIAPDGAASYTFDVDWRLHPVATEEAEMPLVAHVGSLSAVEPPGAEEVVAAVRRLRAGSTISYDINARPAVTGVGPDVVRRVEQLVADADIVKASDEDLAALWPDLSMQAAADRLQHSGPAVVVVTVGAEGAFFRATESRGVVAGMPVLVADTIGAGDTFSAGMIDALWSRELLGAEHRSRLRRLDERTWHEVLEHAARAAAVTVSRPGADPPYRRELAQG